jgi:hypothetical protein
LHDQRVLSGTGWSYDPHHARCRPNWLLDNVLGLGHLGMMDALDRFGFTPALIFSYETLDLLPRRDIG